MIKRRISISLVAAMVAVQVLGYGGTGIATAEGAESTIDVTVPQSLVQNGNFEAELVDGKIPSWTTSSDDFELADEVGSNSGKSLKLNSADAAEATTIESDPIEVLPNRNSTVTVAVYLEDPPMSGAFINVEYYDGDQLIDTAHKQELTGAAEWKPVTINSKAPSNANAMKVVLGSEKHTTGVVYFDDVRAEFETDVLELAAAPEKDIPVGSDFKVSVKATEGVKVTLSEGDKELASVTGEGDNPVTLTVKTVEAGTLSYKLSLEGSSINPITVPVTAHDLAGIQVTKNPVYLKAIAGEAEHSVVTKAVYGPLTLDVSPYTTLEIDEAVTSVKIEGQKIIALEEGSTVVTATYGNKQTQFNVTVLADDAAYPEQKTLKEVGIELPETSLQVNATVTAKVYGNYENENKEIEKVYLNAQHVIMNANPSNIVSFDGFTIKGLNEGETVVKAVYNGESSAGIKVKVTAATNPNPGGGGGSWGGGIIIPPTPPVTAAGRQEATKEQLTLKDGIATIKLDAGNHELLLPAGAHELLGDGILQIVRDEATLEISAAVLKDMLKDYDAASIATARILITLKAIDKDTVAVDLGVLNQDGTVKSYSNYANGVKLLLPIPSGKSANLLGIYSIGANNVVTYVGGKRSGSNLTADLTQPGQFEIQERDKRFRDVAATHWGFEAIRTLYAKQIVKGVNDNEFRPAQLITRAEFVTILARAYELKVPANYTSRFNDVSSSAWYADEVAAAVSSGIIRGVGNDRFAPNALITREEMAVMLVRASGESFSENAGYVNLGFIDSAKVKPWARDAVRIAAEKGWVNGKDNNRFDPLAQASRAEMAQMIYNIFKEVYK